MALVGNVQRRAEAMLGAPITSWQSRDEGLTHARAAVVTLADGRRVFVKVAADEHSRREVEAELVALRAIRAGFMPRLVAYDEDDPPMFAIEDLSAGHWPEPYPSDLSLLEAALAELRSLPVPAGLEPPPLHPPRPERWAGVAAAARAGTPGIADWVAAHKDSLLAAVAGVAPARALVHGDLWYPNICFLADRVVLVDWSHVRVGSPWHDAATVSIDLVIEGRPPLVTPEGLAWAATYLVNAIHHLADGPGPSISRPDAWRSDVEELVDGAAFWVADELGLPHPPRLSARDVGWR